uniref:Uncharacterized protein n=1 Tax=Craspedostauros australis TaxID=1486917 RepID=A0A7R9WV77_9STRA|mmetsp:Transcript_22350/g.62362  ORF Transcript_22350/g.62362 Transcript_22350/m.62362 type:complete len:169 (+) Transcript_22350:370-876(+)
MNAQKRTMYTLRVRSIRPIEAVRVGMWTNEDKDKPSCFHNRVSSLQASAPSNPKEGRTLKWAYGCVTVRHFWPNLHHRIEADHFLLPGHHSISFNARRNARCLCKHESTTLCEHVGWSASRYLCILQLVLVATSHPSRLRSEIVPPTKCLLLLGTAIMELSSSQSRVE